MRILVLTNLYPSPFQPNRATFNRHAARLLAELHPVRVIAPILWTEERAALRAGQEPVPASRRIVFDGLTVDHPRYWYTPKVLRSQYGRFYLWSVKRAFQAAVAEFQPDIVLAPWAYPDGWAAVRLGHAAGIPVVIMIHGSDVRLVGQSGGRRKRTAEALSRADGVIAVSQDLADRAADLGADPAGIRVIIDGVNREAFCPGDRAAARARLGLRTDARHLLFVGSLDPIKGLDILVAACSRLPSSLGDWELHLVGEGGMRKQLAQQAASLGLSDRVRLHGPHPHADLPDWFRAADVFILPSRSEGTPNVLLEAAASGTPFVASAVGGIPDIAPLGRSILVPPEDADQLAEGIALALEKPPAQPAIGPRDRRQAVAEMAEFLGMIRQRFQNRADSLARLEGVTVGHP
jgi:glycosyltransferase involved in cell wall biosynthesis